MWDYCTGGGRTCHYLPMCELYIVEFDFADSEYAAKLVFRSRNSSRLAIAEFSNNTLIVQSSEILDFYSIVRN